MAEDMILDAPKECDQLPQLLDPKAIKEILNLELRGSVKSQTMASQYSQLVEDIVNYSEEDPLRPWVRFIKWAKEMFSLEARAKLLPLLQLCIATFVYSKRYYDDLRYLRIWVRYADCCPDPLQVFAYMEDRQIGQNHSLFYEAYAVTLEIHKDFLNANEVYQKGLQRNAQPKDELEKMYRNFLKRKDKLFKRQQKGIDCTNPVTLPLSTISNKCFNLPDGPNVYQLPSKKHIFNQVQTSSTFEGQKVSIEAECERKKDIDTQMSAEKSSESLITLKSFMTKGDVRTDVRHAFCEREKTSFGEPQAALGTISQNSRMQETRETQNQEKVDFVQIPYAERFDAIHKEPEVYHSFAKEDKIMTCEFEGSNSTKGQMEDLPKSSFSSKKHFPLGDETIAIKKFVDVVIASGMEIERHHGLVDPTINTKEAMADINSLFNRTLSYEPTHKQRASHGQNSHKAVTDSKSQEFSVLADDILGSQRTKQQNNYAPQTSKNMDFAIFVDDDFRESSKSDSSTGKQMDVEDIHEKGQSLKAGGQLTSGGVAENNFHQVSGRQKDFMVYVDDDLRKSAHEQDKENIPQKQRTGAVEHPKNSNQVNPWDEDIINKLLRGLSPPLSKYKGFHFSNKKYNGNAVLSTLKNSVRNKNLELGNKVYHVKGCTGEGAFARVYQAYDEDSENTVVLKIQKPPCPWEFFIYRQLDKRIPKDKRDYYGYAMQMHVFADCSIMVADYGQHGTLQDVINSYLATNQKMDEVLCMYYTIEMLHMLETLHSVGIIHADFKPDNLLMRNESEEWKEWTPNRSGCWKHQGLSLIDWGRSIDTKLYPESTEFQGDSKTSAFRCIEMIENRSWTFQVDTYGLCGVVHCMLHGSYMELEFRTDDEGRRFYMPKAPFKRYWKRELWQQFFSTLLNIESCKANPPLAPIRKQFEDYLTDNPSQAKRIKQLLMKQNLMMYCQG